MNKLSKIAALTAASAGLVTGVAGAANAASSGAIGSSSKSPGVISGNTVQIPVNIPINACGVTVNIIGLLNPAAGNLCVND
jgi:hypothetical protein